MTALFRAPDTRILGVVLAGGLARRMGGGDKGLLPLGGTTVMGEAIARLAPQVDALAINANGDPARFGGVHPVIPDTEPDRPGPLAGVLAGMDWAAGEGASHIVTAAADTPRASATPPPPATPPPAPPPARLVASSPPSPAGPDDS